MYLACLSVCLSSFRLSSDLIEFDFDIRHANSWRSLKNVSYSLGVSPQEFLAHNLLFKRHTSKKCLHRYDFAVRQRFWMRHQTSRNSDQEIKTFNMHSSRRHVSYSISHVGEASAFIRQRGFNHLDVIM